MDELIFFWEGINPSNEYDLVITDVKETYIYSNGKKTDTLTGEMTITAILMDAKYNKYKFTVPTDKDLCVGQRVVPVNAMVTVRPPYGGARGLSVFVRADGFDT